MKKIFIGLALGLLVFNAFAVNVWSQETINFEALPVGTIVNQVFGDGGSGPIGVFGNNPKASGLNAAVIFDSANPNGDPCGGGRDFDLGTPNENFGGPGVGAGGASGPFANMVAQGNILIINEACGLGGATVDRPNDADERGVTLNFDFSAIGSVTVTSIFIVDVEADETGAQVNFFDAADNLITTVNLPDTGDNGVATTPFNISGVVKMDVLLNGSGAIDDIVFEPEKCSIGNFVWEDANRDGCQDPDERPIEGVEVTLHDSCSAESPIASTPTNADGFYGFTGLDCRKEYRVQFGDAGAIYERTVPNQDCSSTDPPEPSDANDSDCAQDDGFSGCITFPDPVNAPDNPTIDCGYVCEGVIGDRVWLDENDNEGCQDPGEPDIDGVTANLFQVDGCPNVSNLPEKPFMTKPTIDGKYLFTGLCPGDYRVTFDDPAGRENTVANINCPDLPPDDQGGDTKDSDCGSDGECVTLTKDTPVIPNTDPVQIGDLTIDCGKIPPPPDCNLEIDKQCRVEPPPPVPFDKCEGKLQQFTVIWTEAPIVVSGVPNDAPNGQVNTGQEVTFFGPFDSNDVIVDLAGATPDQSKFHVSCSDSDFNSPDDCGKSAGNGKGDDSNFNNGWILEGFIDKDGLVLDCNASSGDGDFSQNCEFDKQLVNCETFDKPTSLTFRYEGLGPVSNCTDNAASEANQKPPTCSGDLPVGATVAVTLDDGSADPMSVSPGEEFTITGFGSQTEITLTGGGGEEVDDFHTSCSAPLELGDVFGNLVLVGWDNVRGSADVTYRYEVTNNGDPLTDVMVKDSILGDIGTIASLVTGQSETLDSSPVAISDTTTNTAMATGTLSNGEQCPSNTDSVTVTAKEPTCEVSIQLDKIEDRKIKWKLSNLSSVAATIETLTITWPGSTNLKKVKYDGNDILKDVLLPPPTATIMADEWLKEPKDRTVKAGDSGKTLELEFDANFPLKKNQPPSDFNLEVSFEQGCEVSF